MSFTIGSLFDGSGGFPLAAFLCKGTPVWASEVEPYPIAVTKTRFPYMKHLGSVTDIKGNEVEPVDVITFGSPCQDLSVAGKRAGLKHTDNGDEETTRSGLFMEAVRIIKEMREATDGKFPRIALWENVPGAFSSNKGEDFRVVCEELIKIIEPSAVMPPVPQAGWAYADSYTGDGWSLAYRILDAQFWGVPQRRRRIYLVLDLGGERAREVLFERKGLRGYFAEGRTPWESITGDAAYGSGTADCEADCVTHMVLDDQGGSRISVREDGKVPTLRAETHGNLPCVMSFDARGNGDGSTISTITGDHNNRVTDYTSLVCEPVVYNGENITSPLNKTNPQPGDPSHTIGTDSRNYLVQPAATFAMQAFGDYKESDVASGLKARDYKDATDLVCGVDCRNATEYPELNGCLQAKPNGGFSANCNQIIRVRYTVRRLTPTECARLQGFPDGWGHPDHKENFTEDEYQFWLSVRNTHAEINGKTMKYYTPEQMLAWYNKLHTDSSEYRLWGNGIALPCALYVMQGIADVCGDQR